MCGCLWWCQHVPHLHLNTALFRAGMPPCTPCSLCSPWFWTRMWSQRWLCSTQSFIKTSPRCSAPFTSFSSSYHVNTQYVSFMGVVSLFQGRSLSFKTFLIWVLISVYQGKAHIHTFYRLYTHTHTLVGQRFCCSLMDESTALRIWIVCHLLVCRRSFH